jgi:acetoin utilization protein AcuB
MTSFNEIQNLTVDSFTTPAPIVANPEDSAFEIYNKMTSEKIRHMPVVQGEMAIGVLSVRDLDFLRFVDPKKEISASEVMSIDPISVSTNTSLIDAAYKMSENHISSLIVNDEQGKISGIFTSTDALNALVEVLRGEILSE